jgi:hypothetical protein
MVFVPKPSVQLEPNRRTRNACSCSTGAPIEGHVLLVFTDVTANLMDDWENVARRHSRQGLCSTSPSLAAGLWRWSSEAGLRKVQDDCTLAFHKGGADRAALIGLREISCKAKAACS